MNFSTFPNIFHRKKKTKPWKRLIKKGFEKSEPGFPQKNFMFIKLYSSGKLLEKSLTMGIVLINWKNQGNYPHPLRNSRWPKREK